MKIKYGLLWAAAFLVLPVTAQIRCTKIDIPDISGYKTLKCDLHMHTIYSDGNVTPDIRVFEAVGEGLDAIAFTDHIYGQPGKNFAKETDHNSAFKKAKGYAEMMNLLIINGAEISRGMPPGHINAIFLKDANLLETPDFMDACKEAKKQGGFIFWNHPGWYRHQPDSTRWFKEHTEMYNQGLMQGIEIVNTGNYFPEAHQWCLDKKLTMVANSDAHLPMGMYYDFGKGQHRPITLVFAKDRSVEAIHEALNEGRTAVYYEDILIGKEEYLKAIFEQSIEIMAVKKDKNGVDLMIRNNSQIPFKLKKLGHNLDLEYDREMTIAPKTLYLIDVKINKEGIVPVLNFEIENLYVKPKQGLKYQYTIK